MIRAISMLVFIVAFASLGDNANAQTASLQYDPKWIREAFSNKNWLLHLMTEPASTSKILAKLPKAWCYHDLAFFCKIEVKIEKATRLPIKFRLGDVGYVEWMEGKRPKP